MCLIFNDDTKLLMVGIVLFEFAKIKGAKKFLRVKSFTFRAAKLKGFTVYQTVAFVF